MCAKKKSPSDPDENFFGKKSKKKMERELIFHCCFVFFV